MLLVSTLFPLYINDLPDNVVCNITVCADDNTLYAKCDQASDLWWQLELASELESDLWDNVEWGRKWLVDFNAGKNQLVPFDRSNNTGAIDLKMDGPVLEEKSSFKMLGLTFSPKLEWGSNIITVAKMKTGPLICSMNEVSLSIYLPYSQAWNISTIQPSMEYCCHIWAGAPSCYLKLLVKLQKCLCRTVRQSFTCWLPWNFGSLSKYSQSKSFL